MLFNSIVFCIFFPVVTALYFILPHKWRWALLLMASFFFYMAFLPIYVLILVVTIVVDYFAGLYIEKAVGSKRKLYLIASLVANIGFLCFFKYYDFIIENINALLSISLPYLKDLWISGWIMEYNNIINAHLNQWLGTDLSFLRNVILPIGLSFHTFQAMSYTIEVYRKNQKAERHFGIYALYVMFYPQLVAGPIERPQNMLHQFREKHNIDYSQIAGGLKLMLFGLFKKVVIADRLAIYVDAVYNNPDQHNSITLIVATIFFAFQIYCDFSAYSEIAIGAAKVMGFKLMTNFNRPYFSRNISEFWKRWHISLSSWFMDYLYIPLGGSRVKIPRWFFNLFIVFIISGIWHGADWTFVFWGAINGFYLISAIVIGKKRDKVYRRLGINMDSNIFRFYQIITTFILACFAWIFFRANNLDDAFTIVATIFQFGGSLWISNPSMMLYSLMGIFLLIFIEYNQEFFNRSVPYIRLNRAYRYGLYAGMAISILLFGVFDGGQFIYFQF